MRNKKISAVLLMFIFAGALSNNSKIISAEEMKNTTDIQFENVELDNLNKEKTSEVTTEEKNNEISQDYQGDKTLDNNYSADSDNTEKESSNKNEEDDNSQGNNVEDNAFEDSSIEDKKSENAGLDNNIIGNNDEKEESPDVETVEGADEDLDEDVPTWGEDDSLEWTNHYYGDGSRFYTDCETNFGVTLTQKDENSIYIAGTNSEDINEIRIPDKIKISGKYYYPDKISLSYNKNLKSVRLPNGIKKLYDGAFSGCSSLEEINIPEGVEEIEKDVFKYCSNLKKVRIPKSVTKIGEDVFYKCTSLTEIEVDSDNENFSFEGGVLFNKDKTEVICGLSNREYEKDIPTWGKYGELEWYEPYYGPHQYVPSSCKIPPGITAVSWGGWW